MSPNQLVLSLLTNVPKLPVVDFSTIILCDQAEQQIEEQLACLPDGPGKRTLFLDLGSITFLSASGLGALVSLHERLRSLGIYLIICNVNDWPYELFEATRLTKFLDIRRRESHFED